MPNCTWTKISEINHRCKNALEQAYKIELLAKNIKEPLKIKQEIISSSIKLRESIGAELDSLNDIILEQVCETKKEG